MAGAELLAQGIERRRHILRFVKAYTKKYGYGPSVKEIADELGVASPYTVRYHLKTLQEEGFVTSQPNRHRSLRVVKSGRYPK